VVASFGRRRRKPLVGPAQSPTSTHKDGPPRWITWSPSLLAVLAAVTLGACGEGGSEAAPVRTDVHTQSAPSIYGGRYDDDSNSTPAVVALKVGGGTTYELCSGALLAPNVLLTARHCVANSLTTEVSCDANGQSTNGPHLAGNQPAARVQVFTGATPAFSGPPDALGSAIFSLEADHFCNGDIAFVVLDRPIPNIEPVAIRMKGTLFEGETVRAVGYGQNDRRAPIGSRFRKDNVPILALGAGLSSSETALGPNEFEVGKSICDGDSGGPAFSMQTGAVVGVVSRGGGCSDNFGHIYVMTSGFPDLVAKAFEFAGTEPITEDGTPNAAALGPGAQARTFRGTTTPPKDPSDGSCAASSRSASSAPAWIVMVALAALARRRAKKE
jgi:MYXO-CTERM domain-containing protein